MTSRQSVPLFRLPQLLGHLSEQPGFVCLASERIGETRYSAWPVRSWSLPADHDEFEGTVRSILASHKGLARDKLSTGCGGIAGVLFYEAGRYTVPGFHSVEPKPHSSGWVGQYLWQLTVRQATGANPQTADLEFHPTCPAPLKLLVQQALEDCQGFAGGGFSLTEPFIPQQSETEYQDGVRRILAYIEAGDCYQANLSQTFRAWYTGRPFAAWQALSEAIPVPHGGYLDAGDWQMLSVSPELFLEIRNGEVTSKPIKGTRPRSDDPDQDRAYAQSLVSSHKDGAENLMIVDLIRNDLSHFCQPHTVKVPDLFEVESYRNVHQLVSTVTGTLQHSVTPFEALLSAFPGGSITGAPKRRAMEIIDAMEPHRRGPYCGSLFWWGFDNNLDSNIGIRTLQTRVDGSIQAWAGCGIVADSDPAEEYQESLIKIGRLLETLEQSLQPSS